MIHLAVPPFWAFAVAIVDAFIVAVCLYLRDGSHGELEKKAQVWTLVVLACIIGLSFVWAGFTVVAGIIAAAFLVYFILASI